MSKTVINLRSTDTAHDAEKSDIRFSFIRKGATGVIEGSFYKLDEKGGQLEHIGGANVSATRFADFNLRRNNTEFAEDFRTCVDIVVDVIGSFKDGKK